MPRHFLTDLYAWLDPLDREILHAVTCTGHARWMEVLLPPLQEWKLTVVLYLLVVAALALRGRDVALKALAVGAAAWGASMLVADLAWSSWPRPRPPGAYEVVLRSPEDLAACATRPDALALRAEASGRSAFPSRHALTAGALATTLAAAWRPLGLLAWVWALLVGLGRVSWARHWPSDVVAGLAIGALVALAAGLLVPPLLARLKLLRGPAPGLERASG